MEKKIILAILLVCLTCNLNAQRAKPVVLSGDSYSLYDSTIWLKGQLGWSIALPVETWPCVTDTITVKYIIVADSSGYLRKLLPGRLIREREKRTYLSGLVMNYYPYMRNAQYYFLDGKTCDYILIQQP